MDLIIPQCSVSDESSCGDSSGPITPVNSPFVHPFVLKDGTDSSIDRLFGLDHKPNFVPFPSSRKSSESSQNIPNPKCQTVCFIGAGYVGGPTAAVIALHNPDIRVEVVDKNKDRIQAWASRHLPIHEPGLDDIVRLCRDGAKAYHNRPDFENCNGVWARQPNLFFTSDVSASIARSDIIFLAVNTSTKKFGIGKGRATDMSACDAAVREIATHARPGTIIVEKSTVPCGTAKRIKSIISSLRPNVEFEVLSNPEFMAEGSAIENLMNPDRIIIGSFPSENGQKAMKKLAELYATWIPEARILTCNVWSSELSKLAANAMLAQRVSSINSISAICEATGADVGEIARSIGYDSRIGSKFLKAGLGFGGSCFKKDICSLIYLAESLGLDEVAAYWDGVNRINEYQHRRFARRAIACLDNNLVGKKIAILGFAFKANTGDPRESLAAEVIRDLLEERPSEIAIYDPYCKASDILRELQGSQTTKDSIIHIKSDPYLACQQADAVLIATDCEQFKSHSKRSALAAMRSMAQNTSHNSAVKVDHNGEHFYYSLFPRPPCAHDCTECMIAETAAADTTDAHKGLDWAKIVRDMKAPRWIFDSRDVLDADEIKAYGFAVNLEYIGRRL